MHILYNKKKLSKKLALLTATAWSLLFIRLVGPLLVLFKPEDYVKHGEAKVDMQLPTPAIRH